jgi:hypothetical protein
MSPSLSTRLRARGRIASLLIACLLAWPAVLHTGCEGGSTGVDNPGLAELPVEFRDDAGDLVLARGALEIYAQDHNPALDSAPLLRLDVTADPGIKLTAGDFDRILAARAPKRPAAFKRSADEIQAATDAPIRFNLVFRGVSGSGAVAVGFAYDPGLRRFFPEAGGAKSVRLLPKPLLRFAASLHREAVHGALGRIILPGLPFQATLVDSGFVLDGLPEGRFTAQLQNGDGYLYAVRESLDTRAGRAFTAEPTPLGRIESINPPAGFGVEAGAPLSTYAGREIGIQGLLSGADSNDTRVSILWRFLDKAPGDSAAIADATRLRTSIRFPASPGYKLELAATFGIVTVRDTLSITVLPPLSSNQAKFLSPQPGDTLVQGEPYIVGWAYAGSSLVRLEVSYKYKDSADGTWSLVADSIVNDSVVVSYAWTPPPSSSSYIGSLRLKAIPSDSVLAVTSGSFTLVPAR